MLSHGRRRLTKFGRVQVEDFSQFRSRLVGSVAKQQVKLETLRMGAIKGQVDQPALDQAEDDLAAILANPDRMPSILILIVLSTR